MQRFLVSSGLAALFTTALFLSGCSGESGDPTTAPADEVSNDALTTSSKLMVFDCKTQTKVDDKMQRIQFSVKNIADKKKIEILTPAGKDDPDGSPIKVEPSDGRVSELNDNLGAATGSRMLRISGDSDGFYLLELVLYKNTDYKSGYLRIYGSEDDGPHQYAKVTCDITQK